MHGSEIATAVQRVVDSGWYLQGEETEAFEREYAKYIGTRYCVSCGNGLDALTLAIRAYKALGVINDGDEVIVPANTYIASILAITENNLRPVLVEPRMDTFQIDDNLIERAITPRTRAVMIVHLYGRLAYTEKIANICREHKLFLIEDNAQAHGLQTADGRRTGNLGNVAGHSFYPGKNLGALGDAGCITTNDEALANTVRSLGNYGSSRKYVFSLKGRNSRMDELQAAVLRTKLRYLDADNARRRHIALRYITEIRNKDITLPSREYCLHSVHHIFPVLCDQRDHLQRYLAEQDIQTIIHYPIPPHRQQCYSEFSKLSLPITERIHNTELSIPLNQAMTDADVEQVINVLNGFSYKLATIGH